MITNRGSSRGSSPARIWSYLLAAGMTAALASATEARSDPTGPVPVHSGGLSLAQATDPLVPSVPPASIETSPDPQNLELAVPEPALPEPFLEESAPEAGELTVRVDRFEIEGNTVFSDSQLQRELQIFVDRRLTFAELRQAADAITQRYLNQGYLTSRAILPPEQVVDDGVVQIRVLEGGLESIQVEGTERLIDYVRSRVALGGTRPLNQFQLEDQLRLLRGDPLFSNVEASLRAGSQVGQSVLVVRVTEADPFTGTLSVDTLSPPSVGRYRVGASFELRNLAGVGDILQTAAYRSTTSGSQLYELSYRLPLNPMDGALLLRMTPNSFRITDPDSSTFALNLSGSADIYEVIYRQPLVRTPREEFALAAGFRYRRGNTLIGDLIFPSTTTSVFTFAQDYLRRDGSGIWNVRSQFRLGTDWLGASDQFFSWNGQIQRAQLLNADHLLAVRADLQLSPEALPGSEQFYVGGQQSVRGYDQNARFGDSGLRLSVEDQIALYRDESGNPFVQISPFIDLGYVWSSQGAGFNQQNFLLGTGVGFLASPIADLNMRLDLGIPLVRLSELDDDNPAGLQVYFTVNYSY